MRSYIIKISFIIIFLLLSIINGASGFTVTVIGNPSIPENSLTESEILDIYTWNKKKWSDGSKIIFVFLKEKKSYTEFIKNYFAMNTRSYERILKTEIYINSHRAPHFFKTEEKLIQYVSETKGAIGYISKEPDSFLVKPIVIKK